MRIMLTLAGLALAASAAAQTRPPARPPAHWPDGPRAIGRFDDWTAATRSEAGETICFAFTRAQSSVPVVPGRGDVVLTVTERPRDRDVVALSAGFAYAPRAEVQVIVDKNEFRFYTKGRSGFSGDGHSTAVAFTAARQAVAKSPGPHNTMVVDTFSLRGFSAAHAAIDKACVPR